MPEAHHSMLLSDARQTSPLPANAALPHRSACPPDLDLRQVPRASEGRGHQLESSSNLGSGWHPWRRTGALGRVPCPRLKAPAAVGGTSSMKDLVRCRTAHRRVRSDLVAPVLEPRQGGAEGTVLERDELVRKSLIVEDADEALLHGDAAMPANCAEPGANVVVVAPFEVVLAELAALIADGVLRRASSPPGRLVKYKADLGTRGSPLESSKAERASRPVVNNDCNPPAEGPGLGEGKGQPTGPESCAGRDSGGVEAPNVVWVVRDHGARLGRRWRLVGILGGCPWGWRLGCGLAVQHAPDGARCDMKAGASQESGDASPAHQGKECLELDDHGCDEVGELVDRDGCRFSRSSTGCFSRMFVMGRALFPGMEGTLIGADAVV